MKFMRLVLKNLKRNWLRTALTVSSLAVSIFLVATLQTVLTELSNPPETPDSALRLVTRHAVSLFNELPAAHRAKIGQVDGVEAVIGSFWFGAVYRDPSNFFASFSVDTDEFFEVNPDIIMPEEQKQAFLEDRVSCIVGENLADRFNWKVGDIIFLSSMSWSLDVELTIRGIYSGGADRASTLYLHWDYYNELMKEKFGGQWDFTGMFYTRVASPELVERVSEDIDAVFRNSSYPTKTESERSFLLGFVEMMGNVELLISSIITVVTFAIVLVAANTMAMSIRERVTEIGVLKALGFRRSHVLLLLIGESVIPALAGAVLGAGGARLIFSAIPIATVSGGMIQRFLVTPGTLLFCLGIGLFVGVISAGLPAWQASRRPVADALRRVV